MSKSVVFQDGDSIIGRSWGDPPRKGDTLSLVSERRWHGRRRFRVVDVDRFYQDAAGDTDPVFEPGEVMVHVVALGDGE